MKWIRRILSLCLFLIVIGFVTYQFVFMLPQFGAEINGERLVRMMVSPELNGSRFENTPPQSKNHEWLRTTRNYMQGQIRAPQFEVPVLPVTKEELATPAAAGLTAIWLGHASVLVEMSGIRILMDPVLSDRASPFPIGPRRLHPSPIRMEDLDGIDAVVISHDHYDHLDMETIRTLSKKGSQFFIPLGVGAHLERWGVRAEQIHEMKWWDTINLKGVTIHCTPARHYSGRKGMNNSTLWSSWYVKSKDHSFYFSGDTGYSPHFREIKSRLGPVKLTLMKVGAYGDSEAWNDIHMNPESAVKAHMDLGADVLLPVHWATFNLAYHAWDEPILRTIKAAADQRVTVITPRPGERFTYGKPFISTEWYKGKL